MSKEPSKNKGTNGGAAPQPTAANTPVAPSEHEADTDAGSDGVEVQGKTVAASAREAKERWEKLSAGEKKKLFAAYDEKQAKYQAGERTLKAIAAERQGAVKALVEAGASGSYNLGTRRITITNRDGQYYIREPNEDNVETIY